MTAVLEFTLPPGREAHEPPEARGTTRDRVRMMVSRRATGEITHHAFGDLPGLLLPGDLLVVNTSATIPAAVRSGSGLTVHFSTPLPDGSWLAELRALSGPATRPYPGGSPGEILRLPAGAELTLQARVTGRLWRARLSTAAVPYLLRHGTHIRYSYVDRDWPAEAYQTVFATRPGSAEMPSASRPFTPEVVTRLVARGVTIAPVTLHTGVSSLEGDEEPYPEPYDVPPATARLVNMTREAGGRVIAAGTTVVRALETAARPWAPGGGLVRAPETAADPRAPGRGAVRAPETAPGPEAPGGAARAPETAAGPRAPGRGAVRAPETAPGPEAPGGAVRALETAAGPGAPGGAVAAMSGWTDHVVTPGTGLAVVDGLLTGLHEPRSSHLRMLTAFAGAGLLRRCYAEAIEHEYLWHEFGDVHLLLP